MKKSNIIVVSLIASITLLITMGMMEVRLKGTTNPRTYAERYAEIKHVPIPEFHHVVVADCRNVSLSIGNEFSIGMTEQPGRVASRTYVVKNDTLYIEGLPNADQPDIVHVVAPSQVYRSVRALHSQVTMSNLALDRFVLYADESQVSINTEQTINSIVVEGRQDSKVHFYQSGVINTLDLNLDHSELYSPGGLGKLKGSIRNQSRVQLNNADEVVFNKDNTSHLQIWGN
jgi:hypothetical protein